MSAESVAASNSPPLSGARSVIPAERASMQYSPYACVCSEARPCESKRTLAPYACRRLRAV